LFLGTGVGRFFVCTYNLQGRDKMTWDEALKWAINPGIPAIAGVILAVLGEYWPRYQELVPKFKRLAFGAVCLVVPLVIAVLGVLTAGWALDWETTFWPALYAGGAAIVSGTAMHTKYLKN
jgi:hypothetical protein